MTLVGELSLTICQENDPFSPKSEPVTLIAATDLYYIHATNNPIFRAMHSPLLVLVVPVEEEVPLDEVGEEQSEFPDELDPVEPPPEPPLSFLLFPNIDSSTSPSIPSQFSAL